MKARSIRRGVGAVGAAGMLVGFMATTGGSVAAAAGCNAVSGISDPVVKEEGFLGSRANVVFTLDSPSTGGETITVSTFDDTAVAPGDYAAKTVTYTFGRNQRQRNIVISIKGDTLAEGDETFVVDVVATTGLPCGVTTAPGVVTIIDNDD